MFVSLNSRFTLGSRDEGILRFMSSVGVSLNNFSFCASMEVHAEEITLVSSIEVTSGAMGFHKSSSFLEASCLSLLDSDSSLMGS